MGVATQKQVDSLIIGGRKLSSKEYISSVGQSIDDNMDSFMQSLGTDLILALEKYAPKGSGQLSSSITISGVKKRGGTWRLELDFGPAYYHDYIDKGVKGINNRRKTYPREDGKHYQFKTYGMPPEALKSLEGWAKRNGIELKSNVKNKTGSPAGTLAYYIKSYGIAGRNYKQKATKEVLPKYQAKLVELGFDSLVLKVTK